MNSKAVIIIVGAVAVAIAVGVAVALSTPDFDAILENQDCAAVSALTAEQLEKASVEQQLKLGILLSACMFGQ